MSTVPIPDEPARRPVRHVLVAAVAASLGVGVLAVGLTVGGEAGDAEAVLDVDRAVAAVPPATVPPAVPESGPPRRASDGAPRPGAPTGRPDRTEPSTAVRPGRATASSSLAELLGPRYSARPEIVEPIVAPARVVIDSVDVGRFPIRPVGLESDGQLEVPDETEIGWYRYGSAPGRPGATVLAAHVSWNRTTGPFARLGDASPGDRVEVTLDDGTVRTYSVVERTIYDKDELPRERIWRTTGDESLVLITCGGDFNPEVRRYRQNIVVYAVPVA